MHKNVLSVFIPWIVNFAQSYKKVFTLPMHQARNSHAGMMAYYPIFRGTSFLYEEKIIIFAAQKPNEQLLCCLKTFFYQYFSAPLLLM